MINNILALVLYKLDVVFITPMDCKGSTPAVNIIPRIPRIWLWCFIHTVMHATKGVGVQLRNGKFFQQKWETNAETALWHQATGPHFEAHSVNALQCWRCVKGMISGSAEIPQNHRITE